MDLLEGLEVLENVLSAFKQLGQGVDKILIAGTIGIMIPRHDGRPNGQRLEGLDPRLVIYPFVKRRLG